MGVLPLLVDGFSWRECCQPEDFAGASARFHSLHSEPFRELPGKAANFFRCDAVAFVEVAERFLAVQLTCKDGLERVGALGAFLHPGCVGDLE